MTTNTFLSNYLVEILPAAASPEGWLTIPEVTGISGFGESAPLVRATHFQSTSEEYISGLPDGEEFSVDCNTVHASPDVQATVKGYKTLTKTMRITETDLSVSPNTTRVYTFSAVVLGWSKGPVVGDKPTTTFNFKISGGVPETES